MNLTLPNMLTLLRIAIIPVLVGMFFVSGDEGRWAAGALFVLAAVTDYLDGYFARALDQRSAFGAFLDPIADKLLVAAALLMMAGFSQITGFALLPALIILGREFLISGLREYLAGMNVAMPVTQLAKWKTTVQMVAIPLLLVGDAGPSAIPVTLVGEIALWVAALLTVITGYRYLATGLGHIRLADSSVSAGDKHGGPP